MAVKMVRNIHLQTNLLLSKLIDKAYCNWVVMVCHFYIVGPPPKKVVEHWSTWYSRCCTVVLCLTNNKQFYKGELTGSMQHFLLIKLQNSHTNTLCCPLITPDSHTHTHTISPQNMNTSNNNNNLSRCFLSCRLSRFGLRYRSGALLSTEKQKSIEASIEDNNKLNGERADKKLISSPHGQIS